jgi:hypothetical protein
LSYDDVAQAELFSLRTARNLPSRPFAGVVTGFLASNRRLCSTQSADEETARQEKLKHERRERDKTIGKLKEVIKDLPDDIPVYICYEGIDTEARLVELWEERVSSTGAVLDPRRLVIDEEGWH